MRKLVIILFFLLAGFVSAYATHIRAGEITYKYIGNANQPYRYRITVVTYASTESNVDDCSLVVKFRAGNNVIDTLITPRINGPVGADCPRLGELITARPNIRLNIYQTEYSFSGSGNYIITVENPNRTDDIANIPKNTSLTLWAELVINDFLGPNNSPILTNLPIDDACKDFCFEHNPAAYDEEGDSLVYSLTDCYANGRPIPNYSLPVKMTYNSIDARKGDLVWCSPNVQAKYNIAILIKQYRLLPGSNKRYYIGSILRDMQIDVGICENSPPRIKNMNDTCIVAGSDLKFNVIAIDTSKDYRRITLSASSGVFTETPAAVFNPPTPKDSMVVAEFSWQPTCSQVQLLPYLVVFKAKDNTGAPAVPLVDFKSVFITVIAPAPTALTAAPKGTSIVLDWAAPSCDNTGKNPLKGYYIYRKNYCDPWQPSVCETGVPAFTGYTLIGNTADTITKFTDNNSGKGLVYGIDYSYIVVAYYTDGSKSIASKNACSHLVRDVPIITNVSVLSTGTSDSIWIHWVKPLATVPNLDTIVNPPPYEYKLMQAQGQSGNLTYTQIASYQYDAFWKITDTGFVSKNLNTVANSYTYRVDFYSNGFFKGSTNAASSIFLSSTPADKKVTLKWQELVPWSNNKYYIFRENSAQVFILIDSTTNQIYIDSALVNDKEYCYKVESLGEYSDPSLPGTLYNFSQKKCETPVDLIPPCQPKFNVIGDCAVFKDFISWEKPPIYCSNDVVQYNVYFAPTKQDPLELIYSSRDINNTNYVPDPYFYEGVFSIAGCFAVTAVDSSKNANESPIVNKICVDNCPAYELPNIFTPNGDGENDFFTPLPNYRFVKDVEMKIFNRWGVMMFETNDRNIRWNGINSSTGKMCTDGVYFYTCVVNEITIEGIRPRVLKGFIHIVGSSNTTIKAE